MLDNINPTNPKFEKGRPVYVLLHEDHSHIYPNPDGGPAWSYDKPQIELIRKILIKDYGISKYHITTLALAFPLICNKQAEAEKLWSAEIDKIRKIQSLPERRTHYRRFYLRHKIPHPILYDAELKSLLKMN